MHRHAVSVLDSTAMIMSFVMGVELLLLLLYVRTSFNYFVKRRVFAAASGILAAPQCLSQPSVKLSCAYGHAQIVNIHNALCLDAYKNAPLLAVLCYLLVSALFLLVVNSPSPAAGATGPAEGAPGPAEGAPGPALGFGFGFGLASSPQLSVPPASSVNAETSLTAAAGGLVVFLLGQWMIVKLVFFRLYEDMYNRSTGAASKVDTVASIFTTLAPALISAIAFAAFGIAWFREVDWGVVGWTGGAIIAGLSAETLVFALVKGIGANADKIVSATTDAGIALLWVQANNPPSAARDALAKTLFPHRDGSALPLTLGTGLSHFYHDNFVTSYLQLAKNGALVVRRERAFPIATLAMMACSVVLIVAPIVAIALRVRALDAGILSAQIGMICAAFLVYVLTSKHSVPLDDGP